MSSPYTIHLLSTSSPTDLLLALKQLSPPPLTTAKAYGWLVPSHLSPVLQDSAGFNVAAIISGTSHSAPFPIQGLFKVHFAITIEAEDHWTKYYASRHKIFMAAVPEDPSPLPPVAEVAENRNADDDLELPLADKLRTILATFSKGNPGPVSMLNLLSFQPGTRGKYMEYVRGFEVKINPKYGAAPRLVGEVIGEDSDMEGSMWEMVGLIHYSSAATFGRMLQDNVYKDLDRTWKKGTIRDNPILLLVEESIN